MRHNIFLSELFLTFCIAWVPIAFGGADHVSEGAKKLSEALLLERLGTDVAKSIVQQGLKRHKVNVDNDARARLEADMQLVIVERLRENNGLIDRSARVYSQLFTTEEIETLLKFFSGETGKKFILNDRKITEILAADSDEWTELLLRDIDNQFVTSLRKYDVLAD